MKIAALEKYRKFPSRRVSQFQDIPREVRMRASRWLAHFCKRRLARGLALEPWLYAIYCGQAKRLALNPPSSAWGRSMLAKRGGYAVQRRYILQGRTGPHHPAHKAAKISAQRRARRSVEPECQQMGNSASAAQWFTNLEGI